MHFWPEDLKLQNDSEEVDAGVDNSMKSVWAEKDI